jgi:hypothetical protein
MKLQQNPYLAESTFTNRPVKIEMVQIDLAIKVDWGSKAAADSTHISFRAKEG